MWEIPDFGDHASQWGKDTAHHGYRTAVFPIDDYVQLRQMFSEPIKHARWTSLLPGGFIHPHIDGAPWHFRWQIPVQPAGYFWQNGMTFEPQMNEIFEVQHWEPHAVWNPTDIERIHIVVDAVRKPEPYPEFQAMTLTDMIPPITEMMP